MEKKKCFWLSFFVFVFLGLIFTSCKKTLNKSKEKDTSTNFSSYKISLLEFGTHPLIEDIVDGFKVKIKEIYGSKLDLSVFNGNFDFSTTGLLAKQMVASDANLLVSVTTPASLSLIGANRGMKNLVFTFVSDPKELGYNGLGTCLNTTGLSDLVDYKRSMELIRLFMPKAKHIGYLLTQSEPNAIVIEHEFKSIAPLFGFEIFTSVIGQATDINRAANALSPEVDLFLFGGDNTVASGIEALLSVANKKGVPVFACDWISVKRGALAAISVDYFGMGKATAEICSQILSGADPNKIPVKQFVASKFILNKKTATKLNIKISDEIANTADLIIN